MSRSSEDVECKLCGFLVRVANQRGTAKLQCCSRRRQRHMMRSRTTERRAAAPATPPTIAPIDTADREPCAGEGMSGEEMTGEGVPKGEAEDDRDSPGSREVDEENRSEDVAKSDRDGLGSATSIVYTM